MNEETKSRKEFWRALKFTLFSISAGIIQIVSFELFSGSFELFPFIFKLFPGSYELFSKAFGWPYWSSYLTSLVLSVLWNFTFNRRYTFRSDGNVPRAMLLVALFYLVFTPLSTWWGDALTGIGWNKDLVMIGTMLINFVTEFLYQKLVVYRNTTDTNDLARKEQEKERAEEAAQSEE